MVEETLPLNPGTAIVEWMADSPRSFRFAVTQQGVLLGSAQGCDIRLGWPHPPLLALFRVHQNQVLVRVLAPKISLVVDNQTTQGEIAVPLGAEFSLNQERGRVIHLVSQQGERPPVEVSMFPQPALPSKPAETVNPNPASQDSLAAEWVQALNARQVELASLAQALEVQAQAIDQWHQSLSQWEQRLLEKEKQVSQFGPGHLVPREMPGTQKIVTSPLGLEQAPSPAVSRDPIHAQTEVPNQEPERSTPVDLHSGSEWDQPAPTQAIASAQWDEDDSWDFLATPRSASQDPPWELIETTPDPIPAEAPPHEAVEETTLDGPVIPDTQEKPVDPIPDPVPETLETSSPPSLTLLESVQETLPVSPARFEAPTPVPDLAPSGLPAVAPTLGERLASQPAPPSPIRENHLSRSWKPVNDFASWFFTHRLGLEKPPEGAANLQYSSDLDLELLQPLVQPGWLTRNDAAFLGQRANETGMTLEGFLDHQSVGLTQWLGSIASHRMGPYLVFDGEPAGFEPVRAINPVDGTRAILWHKPRDGHAAESPWKAMWQSLADMEHENVAHFLGENEADGKAFGVWLDPDGLPLSQLGRLSPVLGIGYRLLLQATLGLRSLHQAGLAHGSIRADRFVLQPDGILVFCHPLGLTWDTPQGSKAQAMQKDLGDLASLAWELLEKLFGSHSVEEWRRLLPVSLWEALMRLDPKGSVMPRITSAEELATELDRIGLQIRSNPFTWATFLDKTFPGREGGALPTRRLSA